ncbi:MAG TPA: chemotaxis protein CheA [Ignavibacteriaceae bacterium]|mgnify:CR=1 FL=1|nr:chemotaxis protein CheA [Ignavibacteriaceae bacterium]
MENLDKDMIFNDPSMKEIFDSFIVETREIFENLDVELVELEIKPNDTDLLNKVFRAFHTIKGTSGFLGLEKMTAVTHRCEDILNKLRKNEIQLNERIMTALLAAFDSMKALLKIIESTFTENFDISAPIQILENLFVEQEEKSTVEEPTLPVLSDEKDAEPEVTIVEEPESPVNDVKQEETKENAAAAKRTADIITQKRVDNSIRVDVERLDNLVNIVSELVLGRNRLTQIHQDASLQYEGTKLVKDLSEATRQIDIMTTELQLAVMKTRMVKIGKVFNRFPRLIRDLCKEMHKDIELVIKGEETELDKTLIEEINDPLVHLVRNSVDHGVESPEERVSKGKNAKGIVTLSAEHEGNNIIITVEDDGKGINPDFIKAKAISKGLITQARADELSKNEVFGLIFVPGFSTAEKVTNVSGRGVGMDVVKTNVTKLRGIINVDSTVGQGTKIVIKLPLTLAIIQGLLVQINAETIVIPLNSVLEVIRVNNEQIYTVNQKEVIKLRESVIPLIDISGILYKEDSVEEKKWQYVVIVGLAEKTFGIKVDFLLGQKEVVIKSLGAYLGNIEGIAGSTIMGDGKVVVILDLSEIINKLRV